MVIVNSSNIEAKKKNKLKYHLILFHSKLTINILGEYCSTCFSTYTYRQMND